MIGERPSSPLPFNVITGFLGAGKTTLLNRLLDHPGMDGTLVIVNEFGEAGLDHLLVEASADEVLELSSGCLCCALRGDLVETLIDVLVRRSGGKLKPFGRIVVETSGLADPAPVLHSVMAHPWLLERLRLDGVVTVVDGLFGLRTLEEHPESRKQVALADRLVITKGDMEEVGEADLSRLAERLRHLNPVAGLLRADCDPVSPEELFHAGLADGDGRLRVARWLGLEQDGPAAEEHAHDHGHSHDHGAPVAAHGGAEIGSVTLTTAEALTPQALEILVDLLRASFGSVLLRVKGIVKLSDDPSRPVVIHGVQHVFHPPARLPSWPEGMGETRLVIITRGDLREEIGKLFAAVCDPLSGGAAAMRDDTLSLLPDGDG